MSLIIQTAEEFRRAEVKKLLAEIRRTAPAWSKVPPWVAAELLKARKERDLLGGEK